MAAATPDTTEEGTVSPGDNLVHINLELQRLLAARENKLIKINPQLVDIHKNTERKVENQIAKKGEFYQSNKKIVKNGTPYHIHYTKDLSEYYMTGDKHNATSQLIYRIDIKQSDFGYYNSLNQQQPLSIKSSSPLPTEEDYKNRFFKRYFAKKANDITSPVFEVSAIVNGSSPLYNFILLNWYIRGDKSEVLIRNKREIAIASQIIPNLGKLLPNYQYFRSGFNLTPVELIRERLGTLQSTTEESTTEENNNQSNSQNNTQNESTGDKATGKGNAPSNQTSNQNSGAGAGTTTGGGGGGSSLY